VEASDPAKVLPNLDLHHPPSPGAARAREPRATELCGRACPSPRERRGREPHRCLPRGRAGSWRPARVAVRRRSAGRARRRRLGFGWVARRRREGTSGASLSVSFSFVSPLLFWIDLVLLFCSSDRRPERRNYIDAMDVFLPNSKRSVGKERWLESVLITCKEHGFSYRPSPHR
jgi:hypothetical protein